MYREHATAAYRYALHVTGSREDADDLVQSAFMQAHRHLLQGGTIVSPRAWLATVVRSRASNLRRDRRETAASDQLESLAGAAREEHVAAAAREELDRVRARLLGLPEAQHQAFVLRYWSELSYREIADVLNTTDSAVDSLLTRARTAIMSDADIPEQCLAVRRHLSAETAPPADHLRHLNECARCSAARARLARAGGIAAAAVLVPHLHIAQALAATIPGFTTAAATGGTAAAAAGGTTLAAGKASIAMKAALTAVAVAGSAVLIHTHVNHDAARTSPQAGWAMPFHTSAGTPGAGRAASTHNAVAGDTATRTGASHAEQHISQHGGRARTSGRTDIQDDPTAGDTQGDNAPADGNDQGQDQTTQPDSGQSNDPGDDNLATPGSDQNDSSGDGSQNGSENQNS
jgi:RNA polymerase sigma-70 factor (ECF subfamily)